MRFCPRCGTPLAEEARFCPSCGSGLSAQMQAYPATTGWQPPMRQRGPSRSYRPDDLHRPGQRAVVWILAGFGLAIAFGITSAASQDRGALQAFLVLFALGVAVAFIVGIVSWHVFLYRAWDQAQAFSDRTTPGQAVGLLFVPFYNFYWVFVAYLELARSMNGELRRMGLSGPRVSEGLTITGCVFQILGAVPFIGIFTVIPAAIIYLILAVQFRKTAVAIAERRP